MKIDTSAPADSLPRPDPCLLPGKSLFLDLDGTLFELIDRPEDVIADPPTRDLIDRLATRLNGRLAVVSGRSLAQIDAMLGPVAQRIAVAGSHGCEHRWLGKTSRPERPAALDQVAAQFTQFAQRAGSDVVVEAKSYGVALHYRRAPQVEARANALADKLARTHDLFCQTGKMMVELRLRGADKGSAVRDLMADAPMAGASPVFIGDDVTDEDGFAAALALGGHAVLVGTRRPTRADYALSDPVAVRRWLTAFAP